MLSGYQDCATAKERRKATGNVANDRVRLSVHGPLAEGVASECGPVVLNRRASRE